MSDRRTESNRLKLDDLPTAEALLQGELQPLISLDEVDDQEIDEVISIALRELVIHGERTLSKTVLQGIA